MKRLRRIILDALTVLSLVLCVATVVLWVRSYRGTSFPDCFHRANSTFLALSIPGRVAIIQAPLQDLQGLGGQDVDAVIPGIEFSRKVTQFGTIYWLNVHYAWVCSLLLLSLCRRLSQRCHRDMGGLCLTCSYNLTGNVSGVCPECGAKIAEAKEP